MAWSRCSAQPLLTWYSNIPGTEFSPKDLRVPEEGVIPDEVVDFAEEYTVLRGWGGRDSGL